jgi:hypothetical protein
MQQVYLEVKTGSINEQEDEQGIAHFVEHVGFLLSLQCLQTAPKALSMLITVA